MHADTALSGGKVLKIEADGLQEMLDLYSQASEHIDDPDFDIEDLKRMCDVIESIFDQLNAYEKHTRNLGEHDQLIRRAPHLSSHVKDFYERFSQLKLACTEQKELLNQIQKNPNRLLELKDELQNRLKDFIAKVKSLETQDVELLIESYYREIGTQGH